jgi:hypothetical protein
LPDNFGTPQEANGFCNIVAPGTCNDGGTERDTVPPEVGDVVITEFMANPNGADGDQEWFEVVALADFDLNGLNAGTEEGSPRAVVESPDCIPVTSGTHILFAQTLDDTLNGGLPAPDALFGFTLKNGTTTTGDGKIVVGIGDQTLDVVTYTESLEGQSASLDPSMNDPAANDLAAAFCGVSPTYGEAGNSGTPQLANIPCVAAGQCIDPDDGQARAINFPTAATITEVMTRANVGGGSQASARWFEIRFDAAGDLNEVLVGREANANNQTLIAPPDCQEFAAGEFAVIAASANMADNGLQQIDGTFDFTLVIDPAADDRLFVSADGSVLDAVEYPATAGGEVGNSEQRTQGETSGTGPTFCLAADAGIVDSYNNDNDLGTPGAANNACP